MIEEADTTANELMHDINTGHKHTHDTINNLIEELDQAQNNMDKIIAEIDDVEHTNDSDPE